MNTLLSRAARSPLLAGLVALLVVLFALLLVVMASEEPKWAYYLFGAKEKLRVLEYLGVGMGGVLLAIGAVIANRRAAAMEETNLGAEDGRRQERLKNAIEHLGHDSDSVRLGGAYELFHLAQNTEDLRQAVLDILCAHIRRMTGDDEYREKYKSEPSTEIQSLLTLLFSRTHMVFKDCLIDLQRSWLNGADLTRARLQEASLSGAQMQGTVLSEAQLQSASLLGVRLRGADLSEAQLQGADLSEAQLQGANLSEAQLQGANLYDAQLQGSNLYGAQLQSALLLRTQLQGVPIKLSTYYSLSFKKNIHNRIGRESDLSGATFVGGLSHEDVGSLIRGVSGEQAKALRLILQSHIGRPASNELPKDSGAITGAYTAEEAERWIAEYEEAMRGVPKADG